MFGEAVANKSNCSTLYAGFGAVTFSRYNRSRNVSNVDGNHEKKSYAVESKVREYVDTLLKLYNRLLV